MGPEGGPPKYKPQRPPQDTKLPVHKYPQIKEKEKKKAAEKAAMEENRKNQQAGEAWKQHRSPDTKAGGAKKPAKYWISTRGEPLGPYSLEQIGQLQKAGDIISDDTHIWKKGFGEDTDSWKPANKYLEERRQEVRISGEKGWHKTNAKQIEEWNERQLIDNRLLWNPVDGLYRTPPRAKEKPDAPKSKAPTPSPQKVSPEIKKLAPPPKGPTIGPKQPVRDFFDLLGPDMDLEPPSGGGGGTTPDHIVNTRLPPGPPEVPELPSGKGGKPKSGKKDYAKREIDFILSQIPTEEERPRGGGGGPRIDADAKGVITTYDPLDKLLPTDKAERQVAFEEKIAAQEKEDIKKMQSLEKKATDGPKTSSFDTKRPRTGLKGWFADTLDAARGRRSEGFVPNFALPEMAEEREKRAPLLQQPGESESDWLRRVRADAEKELPGAREAWRAQEPKSAEFSWNYGFGSELSQRDHDPSNDYERAVARWKRDEPTVGLLTEKKLRQLADDKIGRSPLGRSFDTPTLEGVMERKRDKTYDLKSKRDIMREKS